MIVMAVAALLAGASEIELRNSFVECLNRASEQAKKQKIGADGFVAFARTTCNDWASPFQASLVKTNVSHGMGQKAASSDAATQIDDYYSERLENYKYDLESTAAAPQ